MIKQLIIAAISAIFISSSFFTQSTAQQNIPQPAVTIDKIRGANLGGWLVLEPFLTPSLFNQFGQNGLAQALDEFTFSQILGRAEATKQLEQHWSTWVTETHIQKLAAAGVNRVRIPVGFWMFQNDQTLPYISEGRQVKYLLQALTWCAKYNILVHIDLHGAKGSQNGWNHSGQQGSIQWPIHDNIYNTLAIVRSMCDLLLANPQYRSTIGAIELLNEPINIALNVVQDYYKQAIDIIRSYDNQIWIIMHNAYVNNYNWRTSDFFYNLTGFPGVQGGVNDKNLYNVALDSHIYHIFTQGELYMQWSDRVGAACGGDLNNQNQWKQLTQVNQIVGEFSVIDSDCTKWLNGIGNPARYDSIGTCTGDKGSDPTQWSQGYKTFLRQYWEAQTSSYEKSGLGYFYWNFYAEPSAIHWSFLDLIDMGIIQTPITNRAITYNCP